MAVQKKKSTRTFMIYMTRLVLRFVAFFGVLYLYLCSKGWMPEAASYITYVGRDWLDITAKGHFFDFFSPMHIFWLILVLGMVIHIIPMRITMAGYKSREASYKAPENPYDRLAMFEYHNKMNFRAVIVAVVWIGFNSIFAILYAFDETWFGIDILGQREMILLSTFYFLSDLICMMLFCPFQKIMGNRCCVNCRIFDWGHLMMYTPMILIPSIYSWTLLALSIAVILRWEWSYARHPERFWRGSNVTVRCENCHDKTCKIKKPQITGVDKISPVKSYSTSEAAAVGKDKE